MCTGPVSLVSKLQLATPTWNGDASPKYSNAGSSGLTSFRSRSAIIVLPFCTKPGRVSSVLHDTLVLGAKQGSETSPLTLMKS